MNLFESKAGKAAETLREKKLVSDIEKNSNVRGGEFDRSSKKITVHKSRFEDSRTEKEQERILAHELGHAVDEASGGRLSHDLNKKHGFSLSTVSEEMRGKIEGSNSKYRASRKERFADFFSKALTRPEKTKEENPDLFEETDKKMKEELDIGFKSIL